jgi:hypothetical protein
MTDLCGELVQWVGIYGVDSEGVVSVNGSETGRDWVLAGFLSSFKSGLECIRPAMGTCWPGQTNPHHCHPRSKPSSTSHELSELNFLRMLLLFHSQLRTLQATSKLTEPLLGLRSSVLDNLNDTGLQSFDGRNVVGENTHVTGSSGDVDLGNTLGRV